jgi:hypothetical protein
VQYKWIFSTSFLFPFHSKPSKELFKKKFIRLYFHLSTPSYQNNKTQFSTTILERERGEKREKL